MRFTGIYRPEQLAVLSKALDDYCTSRGIERSSPDHDDASYLVMRYPEGARAPLTNSVRLLMPLDGSGRREA